MTPSFTPDGPDGFRGMRRGSHAQARLAYLVGVNLLATKSGLKQTPSLLPAPAKESPGKAERSRKKKRGRARLDT